MGYIKAYKFNNFSSNGELLLIISAYMQIDAI